MTDPAETPAKPVPVVDAESAPFWEAARHHRLELPRCVRCDTSFFPPRALCPACHHDEIAWEAASGLGTVYSFTVSRRAASPAFAADVPYVVALVDLAEGPRMIGTLAVDPDEARIGAAVRVAFDDRSEEIAVPYWVPA